MLYQLGSRGDASDGSVSAQTLVYRKIGQTRDDAAGEAYDKVARLLGLGYPGGPVIDALAAKANELGFGGRGNVRFARTKMRGNPHDFSFSGIKTAVLYYLRSHPELSGEIARRKEAFDSGKRSAAELLPLMSPTTLELLASFQRTVVDELVGRTLDAASESAAQCVLVSGGVAANAELRITFEREGKRRGFEVLFPSRALSTDNAAMIAAAGYAKFVAGDLADGTLNAEPVLQLA